MGTLAELIPILAIRRMGEAGSPSIRHWALVVKLTLELVARQQVLPALRDGNAVWEVHLQTEKDRERFQVLVDSVPLESRCSPVSGGLRTAETVVREVMDRVADKVMRRDVWPGPARGWALGLARALQSDEPVLQLRDARDQGVPERLRNWSARVAQPEPSLFVKLSLPEAGSSRFGVSFLLGSGKDTVSAQQAFESGASLELGDLTWREPAAAVVRLLARAVSLHPALAPCLHGARPRDVSLDAHQAYDLIHEGTERLGAAGIIVKPPPALARRGQHRLQARWRVELSDDLESLGDFLTLVQEITLGDQVLSTDEARALLRQNEPLMQHRGEWVMVSPGDLGNLEEVGGATRLPAAEALRAVLVGEYRGHAVVADAALDRLLQQLREPPEVQAPRGLQATLRPYQARGLAWLVALGRLGLGCCLADDMGLGKTLQVIAYFATLREAGQQGPFLVVCPTSVLGNWRREIRRFAPGLSVRLHHGASRSIVDLHDTDVLLTSYGLLARDQDELAQVSWNVVVLDEAQAIKNPDSRRAEAARELRARHRVALTGTPVENRLDELWSLFAFLLPGFLGERRAFQKNVAIPVERFGDAEVAEQLKLGIAPFLLRRLKSDPDVAPDLPDKLETSEFCSLTQEQESLYQHVVDEGMSRIAEAEPGARRGTVLAMLTHLKQVCNHPAHYLQEGGALLGRSGKLDRLVELVGNVTDNGERLLVFTQYRVMGELLQQALAEVGFEDVPFLFGGTPRHVRDRMVADFQHDPDASPVLLVSLKAGGTGLNLTAATHVVHFDRWWNPAVEDQATDRAFRIGQRRDVYVHKLVVQGTLEERIDNMLTEKRQLAESVVGAGESWVANLDDEALRNLVTLSEDWEQS